MEREIKISNDLNEISVLASFIEELGEEEIQTGAMIVYTSADSVMQICGNEETFDHANLYRCCEIAREITMKDEAVANIIMYAYPTQEQHTILLRVTYSEKQLVFLLTDKGASFDPTQVDEVDVTLSLEERPIGGLGIFLIRSIMNEISYQRIDNENHLMMKKDI